MTLRHGQTHYKYGGTKHSISFDTLSSTKQSNAISDEITTVRLRSTQDCYVVFEDVLDATSTTGLTLSAGVIEYFAIDYGQKISARGVSASGTLEIAEMTL